MKMIKQIALFGSLALLGAGCAIPGMPASTTSTVGDTKSDTGARMCAQLPQVYFFNKTSFNTRELANIRTNVIDPVVAHYRTFPGHEVVSIFIRHSDTGIIAEVIIDQPESDDPFYEGFVLDRLKDGTYPMYEPIDAGPGYEG
jgi:hypothetical protein